MHCIQCKRPLGIQTSANGLAASCSHCGIEHLSLGRLMSLSDSGLMTSIWDMIQKSDLKAEWKRSENCPRCEKGTMGIPFSHGGKAHALIACPKCYLVSMKKETLQIFRESNPVYQEKRRDEIRILAKQQFDENLRKDLEGAKQVLGAGFRVANHLMTETPMREIPGTVGITVVAAVLSIFTMLLPYASMDLFGGAAGNSILAVLTHVTFFHLSWNLLFFCALSARIERESGTLKHLASLFLTGLGAIGIGRVISPFPDAAMIGLSPLIGVLLGRHLVLGMPVHFAIPNSKLGLLVNPQTAITIFIFSELRTMIPTSGGMRWFTLTAVIAGGVISAAFTEWERRRLMDSASQSRKTVHLTAESTMPVRVSAARAPVKKAG